MKTKLEFKFICLNSTMVIYLTGVGVFSILPGTSADEGVGICHSICEYLLNIKDSKV